MKKSTLLGLVTVGFGATVLAACSTNTAKPMAEPMASTATVTYMCGAEANQPLTATYQFKGKDAVAVKVTFKGKHYAEMMRVPSENDATKFMNKDQMGWLVDGINADNVQQKDGMYLYHHTANSDQIVVNYCGVKKNK